MEAFLEWIRGSAETLVTSVLGLYIVVNPSAVSSVFLGLTRNHTIPQRRIIALKAAITGAVVLVGFSLAGTFVMSKLHITAGALRIAGGTIIFGFALALTRGKEKEYFGEMREHEDEATASSIAYTPLAIPLIAGPAPITVVMTSSAAAGTDPYAWAMLLIAVGITCALCLMSMLRLVKLEQRLGPGFALVIPRIMGVILAVLAVQFIIDGVVQVLPQLVRIVQSSL